MHVSLLSPYPLIHLLPSIVSPFADFHAQSHLSKPKCTGCMFPCSHLIPCFTFCCLLCAKSLVKVNVHKMHVSLLSPYPLFHLLLITMRKVTIPIVIHTCLLLLWIQAQGCMILLISMRNVTCQSQRAQDARFPPCMCPSSHLIPCFTFG